MLILSIYFSLYILGLWLSLTTKFVKDTLAEAADSEFALVVMFFVNFTLIFTFLILMYYLINITKQTLKHIRIYFIISRVRKICDKIGHPL